MKQSKLSDQKPEVLLQKLIQFDTTNPPGNERACIEYIKSILDEAEIENQLIGCDAERPNLYAKIIGEGTQPPLLLYGHVDVVPTKGQNWSVNPFDGIIKDDYVWGRGAIDMKGEIVMFIFVLLKVKYEKIKLPFDLILTIVSDEEGKGNYGAKYLIENKKELFAGVKYALGEIGGFSLFMGGIKFYPIMVAEKQIAHIKTIARGNGGHASMSHHGTAMTKIGEAIVKLDKVPLPVRITPSVRKMIEGMAEGMGGVKGLVLKQVLNPVFTDKILKLLGESGGILAPLLHNNINVTMVKGGSAINVIPSIVEMEADLRLVPGCTIEDAIGDVRKVIGEGYEIEVVTYDEGSCDLDMGLFEQLKETLIKMDAKAVPIPFVLSACTDGRFFSRIGIQTYGFTPMNLPRDYDFTSLAHSADERIPISALYFGIDTIMNFITGGEYNGK